MPSRGVGTTYLLKRTRIWLSRPAQGTRRAERDVQLLPRRECDVVLCEVPTCDGDLQLGALHERQLDPHTQALA